MVNATQQSVQKQKNSIESFERVGDGVVVDPDHDDGRKADRVRGIRGPRGEQRRP
jgi:hypothetical protein